MSAAVKVPGSGIAAGAGDVPAGGVNISGAVDEAEGTVDADTDDEGVGGVVVGGVSCSGSSVEPGFELGGTIVGVSILSSARPTRG
jgi:hypothetical protein